MIHSFIQNKVTIKNIKRCLRFETWVPWGEKWGFLDMNIYMGNLDFKCVFFLLFLV